LIKDDYSYLFKGDLNQVEDDLDQVNHSFIQPARHPHDLQLLEAEAMLYKILYKIYKCVQTPHCEFIIASKLNKPPSTCKVLAKISREKI